MAGIVWNDGDQKHLPLHKLEKSEKTKEIKKVKTSFPYAWLKIHSGKELNSRSNEIICP